MKQFMKAVAFVAAPFCWLLWTGSGDRNASPHEFEVDGSGHCRSIAAGMRWVSLVAEQRSFVVRNERQYYLRQLPFTASTAECRLRVDCRRQARSEHAYGLAHNFFRFLRHPLIDGDAVARPPGAGCWRLVVYIQTDIIGI